MESKTIEGKIEKSEMLPGWSKDYYVEVNGERFYKRIHGLNEHVLYDIARENLGSKVKIEYNEMKTKLGEWFMDRLLFTSFGIPRKYREISDIILI